MYKKLNALIKKYDTIIIHRHAKPDGDALGSQFGMRELIKDNFPGKKLFVVGSQEEFKDSSIKNIFTEEFNNPKDSDYKDALVIVVDTANIERIEGQDFHKGKEIVKIDHHVSTEEYGTLEIIENTISSACEIVTTIASTLKWTIGETAAHYLLTGMVTDTGRFMYNSVKAETFKAAAILSEAGAKVSKIANLLNDRDINFVRLQGKVLSDFVVKKNVAYYMMPKGLNDKYNVPYSTASSMVFLLMFASDIDYAVYVTYDKTKGHWKGSLRSRKKPINQIAEEHRGGGHEMAAGFKIDDKKEFNVVVKKLIKLSKAK